MQLSTAACLTGRYAQTGDSCIDATCFIVFVAAVLGGHGTISAMPDEKHCRCHADLFWHAGERSHSDLANLMKHNLNMCINPIYLKQCNDAELRSLSAKGLLHNSGLQQNQASNCMTRTFGST